MRKILRISFWVGGLLLALLLLVAIALFLFVDAEPYRDFLQARFEKALDREVGFGEMKLSFLPTFGLRLDDFEIRGRTGEPEEILLSAKSLRAGARLLPLLRQRLEVTSLFVDRPSLTLHRAADGSWQPAMLLPEDSAAESQETESGSFSVRNVHIRNGRLALRMEDAASLTLEELSLQIYDVASERPFRFEMSSAIDEMAGATIRADGSGMMSGSNFSGRLELERIDPPVLMAFLGSLPELEGLPPNLLGDSRFTTSTDFSLNLEKKQFELDNITLSAIALNLMRGRDGEWEVSRFLDELGARTEETGDGMDIRIGGLSVENGSIHVDDASASLAFDLSGMKLTLGAIEQTAQTPVDLSCSIDTGAGQSGLALRGSMGPVLDLELDLEPVAIGGLAALMPELTGLDATSTKIGAKVKIRGDLSTAADFSGSATLSGLAVPLADPVKGKRSLPLDLKIEGGIGMTGGGDRLELRDVAIAPVRGSRSDPLSIRGTVDLSGETTVVDIELLPARIVADDLAAMAALFVSDSPLTFSSPEAVELELAVRGPLGGESWPEISGRARLSGFTFRHAAMLQPMEQVQASVTLENRRVVVDGLRAVIGASDVGGRVELAASDPPRLVVDLRSQNADFWELFSFIAPDEPGAAASVQEDPLAALIVEGRLSIEGGSLASLRFRNLKGDLDYRNSILILEPLELDLYEGHFSGGIRQDMRASPAALRLRGSMENVAADPFLTDNLGLGGLLTGKASTELSVDLLSGEWETLVTSLTGGGPLRVADGHMAKLEVLRPLSRVAGVFGERTAKRLTRQLSAEGTDFLSLQMTLAFHEGRARFDELLLAAPLFDLRGAGSIDMISGHLDGRFSAVMSPEISALMREEDSRAASLFWNSTEKRVSIPFTLKGPASEPAAGVDWQGAARGRIERKAGDELRKLLEKSLGKSEPQAEAPSVEPSPAEASEQPAPPALRAEISRVRKGGSLLLPDLIVEGSVEGVKLERASLSVVDAKGRELKRVERIPAVDDYLATAADRAARATIGWKISVDGKKVALAATPLTIELVLFDTEGNSTTATRQE